GTADGAVRHAAGEPMTTAPDRDGDEPASDTPAPDLDVGSEATAADGQAREGDLLSLATLSRGGLALSGGYSSIEGPIGSIKLARTNIGAPGRDISLSARYSKVQTLVELGLSDGNFMGSKLALAPTLYYSRSTAAGFDKHIRASLFVQTARGINLYLGRSLDRGFRIAANYRYSDEDFLIRQKNALCDVGQHGSPFCNAIGRSTSSVFSLALSLDRRDSAVNPTRGFQLRITEDIAGPGGTTRYIRLRAGGTFHRRLSGNIDVALGLEGGYMKGIGGRDVPLFDRFYIGGNSMRGFDLRGLGPKVVPTAAAPGQTTAIGGRAYYVGRAEISMRLDGAFDKFGVSPSLFVDAGSVFGAKKSELLPGELLIGNAARPRVAVGIGLSFNVSAGKLRFNIARPVARQAGDRSQTFSITFGTAF
uniref:BamA/OMP85 family outer membrane protein n=1 Tax=Sphingopyxis sp. TaxID=1908224 RepID=UPI0035AEB91D